MDALPLSLPSLWRAALALLAALLLAPLAARAGDSAAPVIAHTPPRAVAGKPVHIVAHITDESRIFPQLYFRYGTSGPFESPVDLKKMKGSLDDYEASIPYRAGTLEYYLECYDEFGNGPAREGAPEAPLRITAEEAPASPLLAATERAEPAPAQSAPLSAADFAPRASPEPAAAAANAAPAPAALSTSSAHSEKRTAPAATLTTHLAQPAQPLTAADALWRSALVPGWGQYKTDRHIRGVAFGVATGASLVATLWLTVRAHQANTIYENAPLSVRSQAYDQAANDATARNTLLGVTLGLWAVNVAEAFFLHGTKDPL